MLSLPQPKPGTRRGNVIQAPSPEWISCRTVTWQEKTHGQRTRSILVMYYVMQRPAPSLWLLFYQAQKQTFTREAWWYKPLIHLVVAGRSGVQGQAQIHTKFKTRLHEDPVSDRQREERNKTSMKMTNMNFRYRLPQQEIRSWGKGRHGSLATLPLFDGKVVSQMSISSYRHRMNSPFTVHLSHVQFMLLTSEGVFKTSQRTLISMSLV